MAEQESRRSVNPNGKLIDSLRKRKGWTIEDFAGESRIARRTIQKVLAGQPIEIATLKIVADSLGVDYASLLLADPSPSTATDSHSSNTIIIHEETDGSVTVKIHVELAFAEGASRDSPQIRAIEVFLRDLLPMHAHHTLSAVRTRAILEVHTSLDDVAEIGIEGFEQVSSLLNHLFKSVKSVNDWASSIRALDEQTRQSISPEPPTQYGSNYVVEIPFAIGGTLPSQSVQLAASQAFLSTLIPNRSSIHPYPHLSLLETTDGRGILFSMSYHFRGVPPDPDPT